MIGLVLAAAGAGSRFGSSTPKQFASLDGRPVYLHALEAFLPHCTQAVVVIPQGWEGRVERQIGILAQRHRLSIVAGGSERQDSVERGLRRLEDDIEIVLVHDAARPHCPPGLIERVLEGARRHGACIPALPISDTVKEVRRSVVVRTLDRSQLRRAQTPQGFRVELLRRAFESAARQGFVGTDEASLVERLDEEVHVVDGDPANLKITFGEDL